MIGHRNLNGAKHHWCRPNEKGPVERLLDFARRNFLVPVPRVDSREALNRQLDACCRADLKRQLRGKPAPKEHLLAEERSVLRSFPQQTFEASCVEPVNVDSLSLVRFDRNSYSVPTKSADCEITAVATVDEVKLVHADQLIAGHRRHWGKEQTCYDPVQATESADRSGRRKDKGGSSAVGSPVVSIRPVLWQTGTCRSASASGADGWKPNRTGGARASSSGTAERLPRGESCLIVPHKLVPCLPTARGGTATPRKSFPDCSQTRGAARPGDGNDECGCPAVDRGVSTRTSGGLVLPGRSSALETGAGGADRQSRNAPHRDVSQKPDVRALSGLHEQSARGGFRRSDADGGLSPEKDRNEKHTHSVLVLNVVRDARCREPCERSEQTARGGRPAAAFSEGAQAADPAERAYEGGQPLCL